ncbi:hypothetical protein [Aureimonas altamirensis]|uniref:hypothetical protein n=1 Tax=Aureimonas altamirensis TaxID=370622 RepID=UPI0030182DA8
MTINLNFKSNTRQSAWRRANPERYRAHVSVCRALSVGGLEKDLCEVCGNPKVDAHHDDYSKPLAIRWLCRKHHTQLHAQQRRETGMKRSMKRERNVSETLPKRRDSSVETRPERAREQSDNKQHREVDAALGKPEVSQTVTRNVTSRNAAPRVTSRDKRDRRGERA